MAGRIVALFLAICLAFSATPLAAQPGRFPATGTPAFTYQLSDGWTVGSTIEQSVVLIQADRAVAMPLAIVTHDGTQPVPLDEVAAIAFRTAGATQTGPGQPATLGGIQGMAYTARIPAEGDGPAVQLRAVLVRVDDTHVASVTVMKAEPAPPGPNPGLDRVWNSIGFVRAP